MKSVSTEPGQVKNGNKQVSNVNCDRHFAKRFKQLFCH